jgi:L-lactate dehydrogenase complex protein LldG
MSAAREEILGRIRSALTDVPAGEQTADVAVARDYDRTGTQPVSELLELLFERLLDYKATVRHVAESDLGAAVANACAEMGLATVVVPPGLPVQWRPSTPDVVEDKGLTATQLDEIDGAITGCAAAIAETGTLVLDGQALSGRRVITLVPDHHICVVTADQVVGSVPEAVTRLATAVAEQRVPVTLISGPSATSDIELHRVEGVHGPRHLLVLIVAPD